MIFLKEYLPDSVQRRRHQRPCAEKKSNDGQFCDPLEKAETKRLFYFSFTMTKL